MPPQSVWRVIAYLKACCEDEGDLETDEASLYRHACELLAGQRSPPHGMLAADLPAGARALNWFAPILSTPPVYPTLLRLRKCRWNG
jgi:hypothetical protein